MTRLTIRARLTLVYGGLFLVAGMALLGVTYLLIAPQPATSGSTVSSPDGRRSPATLIPHG